MIVICNIGDLNMNLESKTKTVRLSVKAKQVLEKVPEEKGISKNQFINECIEAHKVPTSRRVKESYVAKKTALANLSLLMMSRDYEQIPDYVKNANMIAERSLSDYGCINGKRKKR